MPLAAYTTATVTTCLMRSYESTQLSMRVEFVVSQRVATLLTQLEHDEEGQPAGPLKTSLGFLTENLQAYTNFKDLERYQELMEKSERAKLGPGEKQQIEMLKKRKELQPWIGKPSASTAPAPSSGGR